jgi:hypothetical protein
MKYFLLALLLTACGNTPKSVPPNHPAVNADVNDTEVQETIGGSIRVLSNVEGSKVFLDGEERGEAPIDLKHVKPCVHVIEIRAAGFVPREETITTGATATTLRLLLTEDGPTPKGRVRIVSSVPNAVVHVDGKKIGTLPQEKRLAFGKHLVSVSKPGYKPTEYRIVVGAGKITITADLKPVGGIRILSSPGGAQVMLDGVLIGTTPFVNKEVLTGQHLVSVQLPDYFTFETLLQVEHGKIKVVKAVLKRDVVD